MTEEEIKTEVEHEFHKKQKELAKDVIREANTLPKEPASEKENLDLIKHMLKRLAVHQLIIEEQSKKTNRLLLTITVVIAILTFIMTWDSVSNFAANKIN